MKKLTTVLALAAFVFAAPAFAGSHKDAPEMTPAGGCEAAAAEKKLAGAAKTSFLKKCHADSAAAAASGAASAGK